jgi:nitroimidazol reductase NimA-like FMN-containing flavoprotein (pyridoxamine 5'-phosphate oxidase superfamily)
MRRSDRKQDEAFARKVLTDAEYGVLSLVDQQGKPYAVPLSFVLSDDIIYIHGATEGAKLRILEQNTNVVFTCVGRTNILPEQFSTEYESAIAYGLASIVTDVQEKRRALLLLAKKYSPEFDIQAKAYVDRALDHTAVIAISIESLTAKAKLPKQPIQE